MHTNYMSEEEAAEYLRCSPHTLRTWRTRGIHHLTPLRAGRRVLYTRAELDRFVEASTAAASAKEEAA